MIWGPFLLALALGIVVSAGLYFAYLWPAVEPEEPADAAESSSGATSETAEPAATEPATGDAPASEESSPA